MVETFRDLVRDRADNHSSLDIELNNLLAAVEVGLQACVYVPLIQLVDGLLPYLEQRGLYQVEERILCSAYHLALVNDDRDNQATLLRKIGDLQMRSGQF
jgi:hypothetical protein